MSYVCCNAGKIVENAMVFAYLLICSGKIQATGLKNM